MTKLLIPDMSCGHYKANVEKTIKLLVPAASLEFEMHARTVAAQSKAALDAMRTALKAAGCEAAAQAAFTMGKNVAMTPTFLQ